MARVSLSRAGSIPLSQTGAIAPKAGSEGSLLAQYSMRLGDAVLRHRTDVAERAARVEAELASQVKSEFITNISHELRTPLNSILGFSKMLKEVENTPLEPTQVAEYANFILGSASNLLSIVNDVITVSKLQSHKLEIDIDDTDVEETLRGCIPAFQDRAEETGVRLVARLGDELPLISADAEQLKVSVSRLLDNAIRFTPRGGTAMLTAVAAGKDKVMICVSDSGIGMTPEEMTVALTEFGQIDNRLEREHEGTGLGLPIAKALTELQGGEFSIRSEKDKGTDVLLMFKSAAAASRSDDAREQVNAA